jgi:hypothetical protein
MVKVKGDRQRTRTLFIPPGTEARSLSYGTGLKTRRNCQGFWEQNKAFDSLPSRLGKAARSYRTVRGEAEDARSRRWRSTVERQKRIWSLGLPGKGQVTARWNYFPGPSGERMVR